MLFFSGKGNYYDVTDMNKNWNYSSVVLAILLSNLHLSRNQESKLPVFITDTCGETGRKAVTCDEGHVIKIVDVRLMPHNYTIQERDDVARLCNGLNSCSFVDIRKLLDYYCQDYSEKQVYTSFHCVPASENPVCRTNICSEENPNIKCRRGTLFHLMEARCFSMMQDCPREVYSMIYRSCEGQKTCTLSILRAVIPQTICLEDITRHQNLYMDYICVDKETMTSSCVGGTFVALQPRFGILQNPGYPNNQGNPYGCYWVIYPDTDNQEITVVIHEAFTVEKAQACDSQFLQVQYKLCDTRQQTIERFCNETSVNIRIRSCGTVFVTHYTYLAGEDKGSRFLLSYAAKTPDTDMEPYVKYASQCERTNPAVTSARYTLPQHTSTPYTHYFKTTQEKSITEELPINDSNVDIQDEKPTEETKKDDKTGFDPWRVVVVNIFLGLLIVALIMALSFVCYRYLKIGRERKRELTTKSETVTTLDDKQSTEMQLLPQDENLSPHSNTKFQSSHESLNSAGDLDKSTYETTIFHFNRPHSDIEDDTLFRESGSGVSSFLPHPPLRRSNGKQQNAESAYSSLDDEQVDSGDYSEILDENRKNESIHNTKRSSTSSAQLVKQISMDEDRGNQVQCDNTSRNSVHQISIDDGDYAVVNKTACQRIHRHDQNFSDQNHVVVDRVGENQLYFIHAVPEEPYMNDTHTSTTMHLIPEHDCLIHKIPPPPPPPLRLNSSDSSSICTFSSKQADV